MHVQTGTPHRSKSEEGQVGAESAAWQEPVVASEKAPIKEDSQASLPALALGEPHTIVLSVLPGLLKGGLA